MKCILQFVQFLRRHGFVRRSRSCSLTSKTSFVAINLERWFSRTHKTFNLITISVTVSAENKSLRIYFQLWLSGNRERKTGDIKLTPQDLFLSKTLLVFVKWEIQYEFMDIHWLFPTNRNQQLPLLLYHHEYALEMGDSGGVVGSSLIFVILTNCTEISKKTAKFRRHQL